MRLFPKNIIFLFLWLVAMFFSWLVISHLLTGWLFWLVISITIMLFCGIPLWMRNKKAGLEFMDSMVTKGFKKCDIILHIISIVNLLVIPFLSMIAAASRDMNYNIYVFCGIWSSIISVATIICWMLANHSMYPESIHGNRLLGIQLFTSLSILILGYPFFSFGTTLTLRKIVIILSLALELFCFCLIHYRQEQKNSLGTLFAAACLISIMLFNSLNIHLDKTTPEYHEYTIIKTGGYHDTAKCQLDNGQTFHYSFCPYYEGETWHLYICQGWFQEQYFLEEVK